MLHNLFGMKSNSREKLFQFFCKLPLQIRNRFIDLSCNIGKNTLSSFSTPPRLIWYVTSRCNLKCNHCFYKNHLNYEDEFSLEEFKQIVKSLKTKLSSVTLTGGEPFCREDLPDLCKILSSVNKTSLITLPTNGLTPDLIENSLKEVLETTSLKINVQVSLDATQKIHDNIRNFNGSFLLAVETLKKFKSLKQSHKNLNNISVITTISDYNQKCLLELIKFVRDDLKVFHKFQFVRSSKEDVFNLNSDLLSDFCPSNVKKPRDIKKLVGVLAKEIWKHDRSLLGRKQIEQLYNIATILTDKKKTLNCLAGKIDGVIFSNGDVSLCEFTKPFANLYDFNLNFNKLWNSKKAQEMRQKIKFCYCTHPCNISTSMSYDPNSLKRMVYKDKRMYKDN